MHLLGEVLLVDFGGAAIWRIRRVFFGIRFVVRLIDLIMGQG